jgi:uncharacterized membrane protein
LYEFAFIVFEHFLFSELFTFCFYLFKKKKKIVLVAVLSLSLLSKFLSDFLNQTEQRSFFFLISQNIISKKHRGAQPLVHWEYTKGTREREKKERKSTKLIACGASQPVVQE